MIEVVTLGGLACTVMLDRREPLLGLRSASQLALTRNLIMDLIKLIILSIICYLSSAGVVGINV